MDFVLCLIVRSNRLNSSRRQNTQPDKNAPLEEQVALLKLYTLQLKSELESVTQSKPTVSVGSEMQTSQVKNVSENNEIMSREYDRKMREVRVNPTCHVFNNPVCR